MRRGPDGEFVREVGRIGPNGTREVCHYKLGTAVTKPKRGEGRRGVFEDTLKLLVHCDATVSL